MSVKKIGSKLAQGVRQVMEQSNKPEIVKKEVAPRVIPPLVPAENVSKSAPAKVTNKTPVRGSDAEYEILHPERVWPD